MGDSPPDAYRQYIAAKKAAEAPAITVVKTMSKAKLRLLVAAIIIGMPLVGLGASLVLAKVAWAWQAPGPVSIPEPMYVTSVDEDTGVAWIAENNCIEVSGWSYDGDSTPGLECGSVFIRSVDDLKAAINDQRRAAWEENVWLAESRQPTWADQRNSLLLYGFLFGLVAGAAVLLICSRKSTEFWGETKTVLKWTGLVLIIPLAIVVLLGLVSAATSKDPNPKKTLKPQFPETWRSQYPRGSHMNLDGIYEVDGVFRLDRGGHTYFLAADDQWHLLETTKPSGAYMQGSYS